jgi:toxin ParE1/3/4
MPFQVVLTSDAQRDLEDIHAYISTSDSAASARHVLERVLTAADTLTSFPERGAPPKELHSLGMTEFRQIYFKPYRLIYRVIESRVVVYVIADGRRSMHTLLARRLLRA